MEIHEPAAPTRSFATVPGATAPLECAACSGNGTWPASEQVVAPYSLIRIRPDLPRVRCPKCDGSGTNPFYRSGT